MSTPSALRIHFALPPGAAGTTLAACVRAQVPELTWSHARRLIERGKVLVNGSVTLDPTFRLLGKEHLEIDEARVVVVPRSDGRIVFEDAHVVVVDKPEGISSVPYEKRDSNTAMDLVRDLWRAQKRPATQVALHVVHRIDKETSGLLAFAKSKLAERALGELFRAHDIERTYQCVVHGTLTDRRIESRLIADRGDGLRGSTRVPGKGKRAVTHVRVVRALSPLASLLEIKLETGKTHQIRIHLSENGHPIVGERVYIRDWLYKEQVPLECERLLLHAATLGFRHPVTGKTVQLSSPLPLSFTRAVEALEARP